MQFSHFFEPPHPQAECLTSVSSVHILNEEMNTYSIIYFHASLLYFISVRLLDIIKNLITKMSSARKVGFWWMTIRSIFLCVCGVIYIYFIESCFSFIWKYNYLEREEYSKIITMVKAISLHWKRDRWELNKAISSQK